LTTAVVAGSGISMAYLSRMYQRPDASPLAAREAAQAGTLSFLAAQGILLLGISLEIGLVFQRGAEARPAWGSPGAKQFVLTAYYALHSLTLVGLGLWRSLRGLRLLGLILFAASLMKVFLIDLRFLETLSRILSFLALGLLLVATAFLYQRFLGQQSSLTR
ncbi:MAG: DUF2339 domain-containing protein, partial [Acidobacteriota bacterium]